MDASDAVDLARLATCSRALHDLFSDGVSKASIEHCREASNRANISEAHFRDLSGMLYEVAAHRDAALQERDDARMDRDALYDRLLGFCDHYDRRKIHQKRIPGGSANLSKPLLTVS